MELLTRCELVRAGTTEALAWVFEVSMLLDTVQPTPPQPFEVDIVTFLALRDASALMRVLR
jgi:hypothetical protein